MITAIDTNIFLDILVPNPAFCDASANALESSVNLGSLVICDLVYAELSVHFGTQSECDDFLETNLIRVESLARLALFTASRVWRNYRKQGGQRTRILADFLIGAHAQTQASRFLSRDRGFYRKLFPNLDILDPATSPSP
jgi:predicted nucleic acid-binding protein